MSDDKVVDATGRIITGKAHHVLTSPVDRKNRWLTLSCAGCGWKQSVHRSELAQFDVPLSCVVPPNSSGYKDPAIAIENAQNVPTAGTFGHGMTPGSES